MLKIDTALRQKRPYQRRSYLKTAAIFGFTGIYKRLAIALGILTDDLGLDDSGVRIGCRLGTRQGHGRLPGWTRRRGGVLRDRLKVAVEKGMQAGHTERLPGSLYEQIAILTEPLGAGRSEAKLLTALLGRPKREAEMAKGVGGRRRRAQGSRSPPR